MGLYKIRKKDESRAEDDTYFKKVQALIDGCKNAKEMVAKCEAEADRLGLKVVKKWSWNLKWSKMTTTFYKQIRLGTSYDKRSIESKAALWCHEMVHVYQWRGMGRTKFRNRYLFSGRWRWAIEVQAYSMTVYIYRKLGGRETFLDRYIRDRPYKLRSAYALRFLRWRHLRDKTRKILKRALRIK